MWLALRMQLAMASTLACIRGCRIRNRSRGLVIRGRAREVKTIFFDLHVREQDKGRQKKASAKGERRESPRFVRRCCSYVHRLCFLLLPPSFFLLLLLFNPPKRKRGSRRTRSNKTETFSSLLRKDRRIAWKALSISNLPWIFLRPNSDSRMQDHARRMQPPRRRKRNIM